MNDTDGNLPTKRCNLWFYENEEPTASYRIGYAITDVLRNIQTPYQGLQVLQSKDFGRMLVLDNCVMLTERDEFIYHEMIAHVPLFTHPNPRRVLVVGGGDGGTLREVARHPGVESMVLCEIDEAVIQASRDFFPAVAAGFDDPRCTIEVGDAFAYVAEHRGEFDVILVDSADPIGPGVALYTQDFYRSLFAALTDDGLLASQGESPYLHRETVRSLHHHIEAVFPLRWLYQAFIPTYPSGWWSFALASKRHHPLAAEVTERIRSAGFDTRYHTQDVHRAAFALPPFVQELLPGKRPE